MKKLISLLLVTLFCRVGISQISKIYGRVLSSADSSAVPDAHIKRKIPASHAIGTTTNLSGEFALLISEEEITEKIVFEVTCIGFTSELVTATVNNRNVTIYLKPATVILDEIVITDVADSSDFIFHNAIKNIPKNYSNSVASLEFFFRELATQDDVAVELNECYALMEDPGVSKNPSKIKVVVNEFRKSDDLTDNNFIDAALDYLFVKKYNSILYLLEWDPVRHYSNPSQLIHVDDFQIKKITEKDSDFSSKIDQVYTTPSGRIFKISQQRIGSTSVNANYYIQERGYVILKVEFEKCFSGVSEKGLWKGCQIKGVFEYAEYNGKFHLSYANLRKGILPNFKSATIGKGGDRAKIFQLEVQRVSNLSAIKKEYDLEKFDEELDKKRPYNKNFWQNHQVPLLDKPYQNALKQLSVKKNLGDQFEQNGTEN